MGTSGFTSSLVVIQLPLSKTNVFLSRCLGFSNITGCKLENLVPTRSFKNLSLILENPGWFFPGISGRNDIHSKSKSTSLLLTFLLV